MSKRPKLVVESGTVQVLRTEIMKEHRGYTVTRLDKRGRVLSTRVDSSIDLFTSYPDSEDQKVRMVFAISPEAKKYWGIALKIEGTKVLEPWPEKAEANT